MTRRIGACQFPCSGDLTLLDEADHRVHLVWSQRSLALAENLRAYRLAVGDIAIIRKDNVSDHDGAGDRAFAR
jgi:hypothetical protein